MDVRNLRYVLEVANLHNITKAAEKLHLTQPTLSKMVKSLEDELGVMLFDRSGKYVRLTDAGMAAMEQIKLIINAVDNLHMTLDDISNLKAGTIKIGLPPVISSVFVPKIVTPFQKKYPNISFELNEQGSKNVENMVLEGSIDLGAVLLPVREGSFGIKPFVRENLAIVVHKSHPLASSSEAALTDLREEPLILFAKGFAMRQHIIDACISAGFEANIAYESAQWDLLVELVSANLGIAFLPEPLCEKVSNQNVRILPLRNPSIPWNVVLIWNKERYISKCMREFIRFLGEHSLVV
ncbi:LysR family transcriptional regulator [Paenibacillus sp. MMS20-IR301]|uniref:LysR family transcriptional regulator n=1 Tax=Paenibacillus sp. MMS20-IR301 TaxID=2895946 RepID=UPI0028EA314E|nr:LysR family transcriptional regulator [Paenibacillus sp. MMS20-IR301]WNS44225.1 LysR family transcriptional regulator [Paenibacillus sp. MMS20-IR301]